MSKNHELYRQMIKTQIYFKFFSCQISYFQVFSQKRTKTVSFHTFLISNICQTTNFVGELRIQVQHPQKYKIKNSFTKTFHFNHQLTGLYMLELNRFYVSLQAGVNKANALQFPFLLLRKIFISISGQPKIFQNNYYIFLASWANIFKV